MSNGRRSTTEIRQSLAATRRRLDEDLEELELRMEDGLSPRHLALSHPALVILAGVILGVIVVRKPALVARSLTRLVGMTTPWLVKGIFNRFASRTATPTEDPG
jgi:hypothetical protein